MSTDKYVTADMKTAAQPKIHCLWDDRPRFLGTFSGYSNIPPGNQLATVGTAIHLQTCPCGSTGGVHPRRLASVAYVHVGSYMLTISWPTWLTL